MMMQSRKQRQRRCSASKVLLVLTSILCAGCFLAACVLDARRGSSSEGPIVVDNVEDVRESATVARELALARIGGADVTLVTQSSADRAWMLRNVCARWPGELAVSIFVKQADVAAQTMAAHTACGGKEQSSGRLSLAVKVMDDDVYPINELRNMALALVRTSHLLLVDMDFWPSAELYESIMAQTAVLESEADLALVVPAFARKQNSFKTLSMQKWRQAVEGDFNFLPTTLASLASCLEGAECIVFDATWNRDAHSTTSSATWFAASAEAVAASSAQAVGVLRAAEKKPLGKDAGASNERRRAPLIPIKCFKSRRYEPYVVVRANKQLPTYDESFTGYGKNKIEHIMRLRLKGYRFAVLPTGFLIHCPHPWSSSKKAFMKESRGKHTVDLLYDTKMKEFEGNLLKTLLLEDNNDGKKSGNYTKIC